MFIRLNALFQNLPRRVLWLFFLKEYANLQAEHIKLLWANKTWNVFWSILRKLLIGSNRFFVILFIQLKAVCSVTVHCLLRDDHTELRVLLNCTHFERGGLCFGGKFYNIMVLKKKLQQRPFHVLFMTHKDLCSACKSAYFF